MLVDMAFDEEMEHSSLDRIWEMLPPPQAPPSRTLSLNQKTNKRIWSKHPPPNTRKSFLQDISYSDEEIEKMSAEKFKSIVTKSVQKMAMGYLNNMASTHEKSKPLMKPMLIVEDYFVDTRFSKSEIKLLFAFRTRMVRDIKNNFPNAQH